MPTSPDDPGFFGGLSSSGVAGLFGELENLLGYIQRLRSELVTIQPEDIRNSHIPQATDQLDAVVQATETAATQILDACDSLTHVAGEIGGGSGDKINQAVTSIYEACSFQDLTGQRIVKVMRTFSHIETKLGEFMQTLGISPDDHEALAARPATKPEPTEGELLLNGPALPGQGIDQSEIDRLLAELG